MKEKIFPFFIALFLLASLAPAVYELANRGRLQSNRAFELVHNFPTDFNFYLSRIRQGIEGHVSVREQYTSEAHEGSYIHVFYLFLGWIGRWVRVPWHRAADAYHVARVVFGGLLLIMIATYCRRAFEPLSKTVIHDSKFMILSFLLAVTASTWTKIVAVVNNEVVPATLVNVANWRLGGYMPWWSVMDSLQRITFIPHLLAGQALIIFLIMAVSDPATMRRSGNWIFLGILAFILGIVFPPGLVFVIVAIGVLSCLELLFDGKKLASQGIALQSWIFPTVVGRGVVAALSMPALLYLSLMTSFYPWKRLAEFDIIKPLPFDYLEYILAVGPVLPLGIAGLMIAIGMGRHGRILPSAAWVIAWAILLVVFKFIPSQSPLRFSEMIPHVPLGILAAFLLQNGACLPACLPSGMAGQAGSMKKYPVLTRLYSFILHSLFFILISVGLGVMYSSWLWQRDFVDHKMRATFPLVPTGSYVMYPLKDFIAAIRYIQDATGDRSTVILSQTTAGNYIPVYAGNTVYVGHANTVNAEAKEARVKEFFSGRMKPADAQAWMTRERLNWVFYGPQEKEDLLAGSQAGGTGDLSRVYPFLEETYRNSFVTVYRVP